VVRLRGAGTFDPADPQVLEVSSPCKSTVMLDILEQNLYVIHTINPPGDRNLSRVIGVNLPALLLSKNVSPDPIRGPEQVGTSSFRKTRFVSGHYRTKNSP
jgi:hypothetical protein